MMSAELYRFCRHYFEQGGFINMLIFGAAFVILYTAVGKMIEYYLFSRQIPSAEVLKDLFFKGNIDQNLPQSFRDGFSDAHRILPEKAVKSAAVNRYREVLIAESHRLEYGLSTMAAWIGAAPLLGLLGTVVGMMETFSVITHYGIGNPSLLSEGISTALITTETGLITAFPGLLLHNWLSGRKEKLLHTLIQNGESALSSEGDCNAL